MVKTRFSLFCPFPCVQVMILVSSSELSVSEDKQAVLSNLNPLSVVFFHRPHIFPVGLLLHSCFCYPSNVDCFSKVFKPEELRQALMPTLEALYRQDPESLPFRQPVDPQLLGIPVSVLARYFLSLI